MKDTKATPHLNRARLIDWAYCVRIEGNRQSVEVARRLLLFLCTVVRLDVAQHNYLQCWYSMRTVAKLLGYKERRMQYALERLVREGLVNVLPVKRANNIISVVPYAKYMREFAAPPAKSSGKLTQPSANLPENFAPNRNRMELERNALTPTHTPTTNALPPNGASALDTYAARVDALTDDPYLQRKHRLAYLKSVDQVAESLKVN